MATNAMKTPVLRVACRNLSAQAALNPAADACSPETQCTVLSNKATVSSLDLNGALTRVSFIFRAGPRNETERNRGVAHFIRSTTGFSTGHFSWFGITRNVQQSGAYLSCTGDRELTSFNLIATRNKINSVLNYLASVATCPVYKPHEISQHYERLNYQLATLSPQARTIDILHKAAYRTGLGNSLFIKKDHIGEHQPEAVLSFFKQAFTANRASVVGYNINHKELVSYVKGIALPVGDPPAGNSTYYGGEIRKDKNTYFTQVAIATQGASLKDIKEALVYAVLQQALGVGPNLPWGSSAAPLCKAVSAVCDDAAVSALNASYSDSGLFGFFISTSGLSAGRAVEAAFKVLKAGSVSDADISRGKALLKGKILQASENSGNVLEDIGIQALLNGVVVPGPVLADAVDKISASEVSAAARKVASGKFSLAGFGDLSNVPYLDQLK